MAEPGIVAFIEARLAEDELWAVEASRRDESAPVAGGAHWQWETNHDQVLTIDPLTATYVGDHTESEYVSLRSVEEFPTYWVGNLPQFAISVAYEVPACVGGHIARHDPARVLAEIAAKRRVLARHCRADRADHIYRERIPIYMCVGCEYEPTWDDPQPRTPDINDCPELRDLAAIWNTHPDYRERWRIDG